VGEALKEAGFDPNADQVSDEELLDDLQRLHEELGKVPSILDVEAEGNHGPTTYQNRFGSWSEALEAAGFDPERGPTDEELLAELRRLRDELDKQPSMRDMTEHGAYGCTTYHASLRLVVRSEASGIRRRYANVAIVKVNRSGDDDRAPYPENQRRPPEGPA